MADPGLRARVERLLGGDLRQDDLTRLFLYARDRCDGRESVQEIGDFVAHHDERVKGLVTRTTRDWCTIARFTVPGIGETLYADRLPPNIAEVWRASLGYAEPRELRRRGFAPLEAKKLLASAIKKLVPNRDGTLSVTALHSEREFKLIEKLLEVVTRPAFYHDKLFEDFAATLKSHGLLQKEELRDFERLKPAIGLFAVSVMHNCIVVLEDGTRVQLSAAPGSFQTPIEVLAGVPVEAKGKGPITLATPMFVTNLPWEVYGDPALLASGEPPPWDFYLELTPETRLAKLG